MKADSNLLKNIIATNGNKFFTVDQKRETLKNFIDECGAKIFHVTFIKKTTGEVRTMQAKQGVFKYSKGGENTTAGLPDVLSTFDMGINQYRNINLDGVTTISCGKRRIDF